MKVISKERMRDIDTRAARDYGIPSVVLMENAGNALFRAINENIPDYRRKHFVVFCGSGNNGGDGAVVARKLFLDGAPVMVVFVADISKASGDNKTNFDILRALDVPAFSGTTARECEMALPLLDNYDVIIDAIYGIGFRGEPDQHMTNVFNYIVERRKTHGATVVAADIPSGVYADGGRAGSSVFADITVTFGAPKPGIIDYPGMENCGRMIVAPIDLPPALLESNDNGVSLFTEDDAARIFIPRAADSHKGKYGHLLTIGGSTGMAGAVEMAASSALRAGAGLVTAYIPESLRSGFEAALPEAMLIPFPDDGDAEEMLKALDGEIARKKITAVSAGNGWGRDDYNAKVLDYLISRAPVRGIVLDADALNLLSENRPLLDKIKTCGKQVILTPHLGEMSRLTGKGITEIKERKADTAREFAKAYEVWVVLKDAVTVIADPDGRVWYQSHGSPALAKGGSGDILCGLIAGFLASGYMPGDAALMGSFVLGRAGEAYSAERCNVSAMGRDIIALIPDILFGLQKKKDTA
ncbi:MAG: NAD(P)H-hydrate dehydratase [Brevinematales bacterium]|nr:NAD(P)H-hydrate dehydratase [Brevinematales bacterium]